jgi:IS5 family transposase
MFKVLVLQSLYNLGDDAMEYQIKDRLSFMGFLGLSIGDCVPDAKDYLALQRTAWRTWPCQKVF